MGEPEWTLPHVDPLPWAHAPEREQPELEVEGPESTATAVREKVDKALTLIHGGMDGAVVFKDLFAHSIAKRVTDTVEEYEEMMAEIEFLAESAEMVGLIAFTVGVPIIMYDVFTTGLRVNEQKGYCYGVMWGALGPESEPRSQAYLAGITDDGERRAFQEGVEQGKQAVREHPDLKDSVRASVLYESARQAHDSYTTPESRTLNKIWEQVHDKDSAWRGTAAGVRDTHLDWKQPGHMYGSEMDNKDHLAPKPKF